MPTPAAKRFLDLPGFASRFVGREREMAEVSTLVGKSRLVTLIGTPGSGKTRLALEVARRIAPDRRDNAYLVELAPLAEGGLLPETFANAIGIIRVQTRPMLDLVLDRLTEAGGLLVVDNCEHLVEACAALIDQVIRRCPDVRVLATSREPLRIDGEKVWPVPTLAVPAERASIQEIARSEAVQLFVDRARQASPRFELTKGNASEVASICRRLDGLPLALEVAAARVAVVDLASISEQLNDRFRFLTSGFRTAPPRQRTLRAAIDWSYDLLTSAERQLFVRLSVFAGTFDATAAQGVCSGGSVLSDQVLELLGRLIEKSLVTPVDAAPERRRYRLLESLRAYGLDRLRESGDDDPLRRRHAQHFVSVASGGFDTNDSSWLPRTRLEVDNLREALAWSRDADPALHLRLGVLLGTFCMRAGFMSEGRKWVEPALAADVKDLQLQVRANDLAAFLAWRQADFDSADRFASSAVRVARSMDDDVALARVLGTLAFVRIGALRFDSIPETVQELLSIARRRGDKIIEGEALFYLGLAEAHGDDVAAACDLLARSVALYEAAGKPDEAATPYNAQGWMYLRLHDAPRARAAIARGLQIRMHQHDDADMGGSLDASAELAFIEGAPERAMRLKGAVDALRDSLGSVPPSLAAASRSRWVVRAENVLGPKAHATWLEGRQLTLDEAVQYALAPPDQPPPRTARQGEQMLSSREMEVAELVTGGMSNDEIAARLKLSRRTVEAHLDHIRGKLGARSRVEVATWVTARAAPPPASPS
jgi:predicted ATPase/DNA-binding CsgD family transcriptional regulator